MEVWGAVLRGECFKAECDGAAQGVDAAGGGFSEGAP